MCGFAFFFKKRLWRYNTLEEGTNNKREVTYIDQRTYILIGIVLHVSIKSVMLAWNVDFFRTELKYPSTNPNMALRFSSDNLRISFILFCSCFNVFFTYKSSHAPLSFKYSRSYLMSIVRLLSYLQLTFLK